MPSFKRRNRCFVAATFGFGALALTLLCGSKPAQAVITVNYTVGSSLASDSQSALIQAAFQRAANRWTSVFSNTFTFNLTIDFAALGGPLGVTDSTQGSYTYAQYRTSLIAGATSADDAAAVASLPTTSLPILINRTSDNPNGAGSATPFLDNDGSANNTTINMTNANAKALGLLGATDTATDAEITFSSDFRSQFDFNPDDGIDPAQYDFVGIATHEIGHALGFISGVDVLDFNGGGQYSSNDFTFVTPLDTFRFSSDSASNGNAIDFTADTRDKYFSLDRGATKIASFSTGVTYGDGRQNSHWKDNQNIGIMDPTAANGELLSISNTDLRAFDVIGYRLGALDTPEPSTFGLIGFAGLGLVGVRKLRSRRRRSAN